MSIYKRRIALENRGKIVALDQEGYSQRQIADRVECCQKSVSLILKKEKTNGSLADRPIPGRARKTTRREDSLLVRKNKADRFKTAPQIRNEIRREHGIDISISTTQRRLREVGLIGRKPRRKPRLTVKHKKARIAYARAHRDWTPAQWARVIFSDESRFLLYRSDGRVYVRRMPGEEFHETCVQTTVKHGGGGIMVWGCMTANGIGLLCDVKGSLNGRSYIDILDNNLIPSIHLHALTNNCQFQQDNAPCHRSSLVKEWFESNGIDVMDWPAQSPDLNPIENLWDHIGTTIHEYNPTNHKELLSAIHEAWNGITIERLSKLYDSMPRKCAAVIKAMGGPTRY